MLKGEVSLETNLRQAITGHLLSTMNGYASLSSQVCGHFYGWSTSL